MQQCSLYRFIDNYLDSHPSNWNSGPEKEYFSFVILLMKEYQPTPTVTVTPTLTPFVPISTTEPLSVQGSLPTRFYYPISSFPPLFLLIW